MATHSAAAFDTRELKRWFFLLLGVGLFLLVYYSPPWPDAVDPAGKHFALSPQGKGALAVFLLASTCGFFRDITGKTISFFEYSYYFMPVGWLMVFLIWGLIMVLCKPERATIPGLRTRARQLLRDMGPISAKEASATLIIISCVVVLALQSFFPALAKLNKSAILIITTLLFYILKILEIRDLEEIPWNIILLFSGAMSMGLCLWETQAANWLAVNWLVMFRNANWFVFVMGIGFFVMIMTNFIMNVAAIAISLPVALVIAPYLGVAPEVIFYAALVTAGMPFLLLIGAAPNAIAYDSKQFTTGEFFVFGIYASLILMAVLAFAVYFLWPLMGMPVKM